MSWTPRSEGQEILNYAMAKIRSVPYKPSSRWLFYRVMQAGFITKKQIGKYDYLLSRARKTFYGEWRPDTLTDSVRQAIFRGECEAWFDLELDAIADQDYYVQLWFEAEAMHQQFEFHTKGYRVSLIPFRGDCSIPVKWQIAKTLEDVYEKYAKPIKILFFGDCDKKDLQILDAAVKDIRAWCKVPFNIQRVGLTLEQAKAFNLPENPDKPNNFQWESLEDEDARKLILESLTKYLHPLPLGFEEREKCLQDQVRQKIIEVLKLEGIDGA
jgi:hypothetical protein